MISVIIPTMNKLTDKQTEIFNYIKQHLLINGYQPTQREIAIQFGNKNVNAITNQLKALDRKGFIKITGIQRGLKILR